MGLDKNNDIPKPQGEKTETEIKRSKSRGGDIRKPHREMSSCRDDLNTISVSALQTSNKCNYVCKNIQSASY
jgi:hypothetical protein